MPFRHVSNWLRVELLDRTVSSQLVSPEEAKFPVCMPTDILLLVSEMSGCAGTFSRARKGVLIHDTLGSSTTVNGCRCRTVWALKYGWDRRPSEQPNAESLECSQLR